MALGTRGETCCDWLGHGFRLALAGVTMGVFAAWVLTRLLGTLLGAARPPPLTYALVVLVLGRVVPVRPPR